MTSTDSANRIIRDMSDEEYHRRPELSSTGARLLLKSTAKFAYAQTHKQSPKAVWDLGTAAHTKVLGTGARAIAYPPEHLTPSGNVSTKAATVEWAEQQRDAGLTPITPKEMRAVDRMAEAVLAHPAARALLEQDGTPETSMFATDPDTGVEMRARFDYLPSFAVADPWTVDLKTACDASPEGFARAAGEHRYDIQQEFYLHAYGIVTGDYTARMKFIAVEKEPPYLVGVYPLSLEFAELGRAKVRQALETYAACKASNVWPGYPEDADPLQPPSWLMFTEGLIE
jgi:hypothetical protein